MSHYFSRVRLLAGLHHTPWLRDLARQGEAYRDHALLWRLFPGDGLPRDFIFRRLDDDVSYYVVSARPPQDGSGLFQIQTKPYAPQLAEGMALGFELRANPVRSRRNAEGKVQRHDVLMEAKRRAKTGAEAGAKELAAQVEAAGKAWLLERASQWGLHVRDESLLQKRYTQHRLKRKGQQIAYSSLDYQGVADVADASKLLHALLQGVGHSKGFGCGLLLVKRL